MFILSNKGPLIIAEFHATNNHQIYTYDQCEMRRVIDAV